LGYLNEAGFVVVIGDVGRSGSGIMVMMFEIEQMGNYRWFAQVELIRVVVVVVVVTDSKNRSL
jgi:hypothetical protein